MNIQEVSDILGVCWFLRAPKHVFITDEPVYEGLLSPRKPQTPDKPFVKQTAYHYGTLGAHGK